MAEWKDSDNIAEIFNAFEDGRPEYPVVCPDCGCKSGHIYIHRHNDTDRGGAWAWCSSCHSYGHYSSIIPPWWFNLAMIDEDKLCGADPEELVQYEESIDSAINDALIQNRMSDNVCRYCTRKNLEMPRVSVCPECGQEALTSTIDGLSLVLECSNCGYGLAGVSFWPPCMNDNLDYTLSVAEVETEQKVKLAKLFGVNVLEIYHTLKEEGCVRKTAKLDEMKAIYETLCSLGVKVDCQPDFRMKFPDLSGCKFLRK